MSPVDLLYVDPPWRLTTDDPIVDYGKQSISEISRILGSFKTRLLALWVVNYVNVDVLRELTALDFEVLKIVDWVKLTNKGNLMKTRGFYLQHSKESLIIARRRMEDRTTQISDRDLPDMFFAQQTRPSAKPREAQHYLETWFPEATNRLELYARNNNLRAGWKSIGNQLQKEGIEGIYINPSDIPDEFKPRRPPREGVT